MKRGVILQNRKLKIPSEVVYILAVALLSLAVAMLTAANFGVSMIVAPAYLLSLKVGILTFGQAEYVIQAGAVYYLLHRHARIQGGVSLVVRDLPYIWRGARSLAVHPVL